MITVHKAIPDTRWSVCGESQNLLWLTNKILTTDEKAVNCEACLKHLDADPSC